MSANIVRYAFVLKTLLMGVFGALINCAEPYLPAIVSRGYRYGKFSATTRDSVVGIIEVPKRWFRHFYVYAAPVSYYALFLAFDKYFRAASIPSAVYSLLDVLLGDRRRALASPEDTFVAILLLTVQCCKRLYETTCVSVFSNKNMNLSHYLVGFLHYTGTISAVVGESEGFVRGTEGVFLWGRLSIFTVLYAFIFLWACHAQLRANFILAGLRKDDKKIVSESYKVPHGELFEYVSTPLNFTEITMYVMLSLILWDCSTYHYVTIWVIVNQVETALLTHWWYQENFKNYPKDRKAVLPFLL